MSTSFAFEESLFTGVVGRALSWNSAGILSRTLDIGSIRLCRFVMYECFGQGLTVPIMPDGTAFGTVVALDVWKIFLQS